MFPASDGDMSMHMTSAWWPWNVCMSWPVSTSHSLHVLSPLPVKSFFFLFTHKQHNFTTFFINKKTSTNADKGLAYLLIGIHEFIAWYVVGVIGDHALMLAYVFVCWYFVHGYLIVETATRDKRARRRIGTCHDPRGGHGDHVLFVGAKCVPYH